MTDESAKGWVHAICGVYLGVLCAHNAVQFAVRRGTVHAGNAVVYGLGVCYELINAKIHWSKEEA
jgi:hypothetical protein